MSRRAVGAALCAAAAIALVVAGFAPWWRIADRGENSGVRANFSLVSGELCRTDGEIACKDLSYTGRPGLRDELFAWTGRVALAALLATAVLALVLAFAGGGRRAILRGVTASTAAIAAGLGAAVITLEQLPMSGDTQLAAGLWAALFGAVLASAAAAWPVGEPGTIPALRRWGLAAGVLALALIAWSTIGLRAWWSGTGTFSSSGMSPLGIELCDRAQCTQLGIGPRRFAQLASMTATAALTAAMLAVAAGLAVRALRGVAPRGWAIASAVVGSLAVIAGATTLVIVPRHGATIAPGAWGFLVAGVGQVALAIVSVRFLRWIDPVDATDEPGPRVVPFGLAPSGPKPVLAALGASPAPAPVAIAPAAAPIARRPAPLCPTCRSATLWHGKRAAWWCTTCKHAL